MPSPVLMRRKTGSPYKNMAAQFVLGSTQYANIADNAALSMGAGVVMTWCYWLYADSLAALQIIGGKTLAGAAATNEYYCRVNNSTSKIDFIVSTGAANQAVASTPTVTPGQWVFVTCYQDGATIGISMDNGTFATSAFVNSITDGTQAFALGAGGAGANPLSARLDSVGIWKRVLTAADITRMYNGGTGLAYRDLGAADKTSLVAWWDLDGNFNDSHGANHLTPVNAPTFTAGKR